MVVVGKGFAQSVDCVKRQRCRIQRVYTVLRTAACVRSHTVVHKSFLNVAVAACMHVKQIFHAGSGVEHKRHVHAVEVSAVQKFVLAAVILYYALSAQRFAEVRLNFFLSRHGAQTDGTAKTVQHVRFLQRKRDTHHCRALSMVSAGMGVAVYRFGMIGHVQRVQLAQNKHLRPRSARVDVGVKPGNVARLVQCVTDVFKDIFKVCRRLPLGVARFGMFPDVAFRSKNFVAMRFYRAFNKFDIHFRRSVWLHRRANTSPRRLATVCKY